LRIVPATIADLEAALESDDLLGERLGARVPDSWPPEFLGESALLYTLDRLREGADQVGWWLHFVLREAPPVKLVGSAGYKGPPQDGEVEIGYGIVAEEQRRGYATETARGLINHAFARPDVDRIRAETLPELKASIGVLRKCGFQRAGPGSEPGVIRFVLDRPG